MLTPLQGSPQSVFAVTFWALVSVCRLRQLAVELPGKAVWVVRSLLGLAHLSKLCYLYETQLDGGEGLDCCVLPPEFWFLCCGKNLPPLSLQRTLFLLP